jgi:rfaE bifunctional protein nucleotidyltransferase chain/domain
LEPCCSIPILQYANTPILLFIALKRNNGLIMDALDKIVTLEDLVTRLNRVRKSGQKIVFTNGCFDILHVGHVRYLAEARSQGDMLIVGLNSDGSMRTIKGDKRPIVRQDHRAEILASLACVDFVVIFEEPDPLRLIQTLKPDVLVKGEDWAADAIIGAGDVKSRGGKIVRISFAEETSTTAIIETILQRHQGD